MTLPNAIICYLFVLLWSIGCVLIDKLKEN